MNSGDHHIRLSRRALFQTVFASSVAAAGLEPVTAQTATRDPEIARCTVSQVHTDYGSFAPENLTLSLRDFSLTGSMTNNTDRGWHWASFLLRMRDHNGQTIQHDDRFDGYFYLKDIGKGETKPIVSVDGEQPGLLLRPSTRPASFEINFIPERSYFDSRCLFWLVHPAINKNLEYQDDLLKLAFTVTQKELRFRLINRLPEPITLDWEKVTYIDLSGNKHRVIHQGVPLREKDKKQKPTRVEAGAALDEMVYPADLVAGSRVFEDWRLNPVMPLPQYAPDYRWRTFGLLLPLQAAGKEKDYLFTIRIEDVVV
jgi:hypothetical protein